MGARHPLPVLHLPRLAYADQRGGGLHGGGLQSPLIYLPAPQYGRMGQSPAHPYVCAVNRDGGLSFVEATKGGGGFRAFTASCYLLEDDQSESYCYPAILEVADGFLVAYYHSNGTGICLNSTKITKVRYDELLG